MPFFNLFKREIPSNHNGLAIGKKEAAALKIEKTMSALSVRQELLKLSNSQMKTRHIKGLTGFNVSTRLGRLTSTMIAGTSDKRGPWWFDEDVTKLDIPDDISGDKPVVIDERKFPLSLLDGRDVTSVRQVVYDPKTKKRTKTYWAEFHDGSRISYNTLPKHLIPLYGIDSIDIDDDSTIILVESQPPTDALRKLGFKSVGTATGAFVAPSERALDPLLKAKTIILWPDNDNVGVSHMQKTAKRLDAMGAKDLLVIRWIGGPRKGDAADFGGDTNDIRKLIDDAKPWSKEQPIASDSVLHLKRFGFASRLQLPNRLKPATPKLESIPPFTKTVNQLIRQIDTAALNDEEREAIETLLRKQPK